MNKQEFIDHIANQHGCTKKEAEKSIDMFTLSVIDAMGQGTEPDLIIAPVGGGGLSAGIILAMAHLGYNTPLHLVEPKGAPSLHAALEAGHPIKLKKIDTFVESIIDRQIESGQFLNANITFKEIQSIKKVLKLKLANIYHLRIEYPE